MHAKSPLAVLLHSGLAGDIPVTNDFGTEFTT